MTPRHLRVHLQIILSGVTIMLRLIINAQVQQLNRRGVRDVRKQIIDTRELRVLATLCKQLFKASGCRALLKSYLRSQMFRILRQRCDRESLESFFFPIKRSLSKGSSLLVNIAKKFLRLQFWQYYATIGHKESSLKEEKKLWLNATR